MTDRTSPYEPIGSLGLPLYSGSLRLDPNPKLTGMAAIRVYRQMAHDEPAVRAWLSAATNLLGTRAVAVPGGETDADQAAAEHLQAVIDGQPFATTLRQSYSMLWAGWCVQEQVYERRGDGTVGFRLELRRQSSLERWLTDEGGRVSGMEQRPAPDFRTRRIPFDRAVHLVADDGEGSPEGLSTLRGMYRPWQLLRNLEVFMGISAERFGSGLPVFEVEAGVPLTDEDRTTISAIGNGLRQNEEAWLLLPAGVRFRFAESPGLDVGTYLEIIRYLRLVMLATQLADFIGLGTQNAGGGGSYALGQDKSELFLMSLNGYQDRVADAYSRQAIARAYALPANRETRYGTITAPPRLTLPAVRRYDLGALGAWINALDGAGALTLTEEDEAHLRQISDLLDRTPGQIRAAREAAAAEAPDEPDDDAAEEAPDAGEGVAPTDVESREADGTPMEEEATADD